MTIGPASITTWGHLVLLWPVWSLPPPHTELISRVTSVIMAPISASSSTVGQSAVLAGFFRSGKVMFGGEIEMEKVRRCIDAPTR